MPHIAHHHHHHSHHPTPLPSDIVPPIPPRTRTRPRSNSIATGQPTLPPPTKTHVFRLDELPTPEQEWQLLENIGDGTYGEVFRAKHIRNPDFYAAVKIMHPTNEVLEEIEQEYRVLFELSSHENLCRFYGAYLKRSTSPPPRPPREKNALHSMESSSIGSFVNLPYQLDQLWLVMELCTSGSVTDLTKSVLKANQRLDESIIAYILRETCNALHYLHSNNVIHRDVKGHNILITGDGNIKLIDFGVSAFVRPHHGRRNTSVGTPFFMAPEVIVCERQTDCDYDARADVWSTGITAIEMAEGEPPLSEMHPMRALVTIPRNPPPTLRQPFQWSNEFNDFIRQCLIKNFETRPSISQMLQHRFLIDIPLDGNETRRKIVQIIHRYKRCFDICMKKTSRETCGVKNGHIRGKSETCSSVVIEAAVNNHHEAVPKRPAPPPPPLAIEYHHQPTTTTHKTKRKSQSRRQSKPTVPSVCHPSLSTKSFHPQFYNSTYDLNSPHHQHIVNDLAQLESFDEQSIINCMYHRFLSNEIYTYIGDILVAMNPFRSLPIYGKDQMNRYRQSIKSEQPPHIYGLADLTYQAMLHDDQDQYIVISGESGAGKTQSANFLVQQLTFLGNAPNKRLQEKILQINPLIEGFGNARTLINDNSSRFGKYLEMLFTREGRVTGARLSEYLLEKTRVVNQGQAERNFHIFYYLFHGVASSKINDPQAFYLVQNHTYRYLKTDLEDQQSLKENSQTKFRTIEKCFEIIGFQKDEVTSIYRILAGLLHLGNFDFYQHEGHFIDGKTCLTDRFSLEIVCDLFGLDPNEFEIALTTSNIVTRGETIQRSTTLQESQSTRDAMAKALYNRLFSWIVNRISALLAPSDDSFFFVETNLNNNNNNSSISEDESIEEFDQTLPQQNLITSLPPVTMMCAMRRTLDFLDMTPSSSSFLMQLPQSDDDLDDEFDYDECINTNNNNNNNNNGSNSSPTSNSTEEKPVQHLIDNWTRAVAASTRSSKFDLRMSSHSSKKSHQRSSPCLTRETTIDEMAARKIAILDIFGFENFSSNTFEQLCINITNEQIQYYFNQHVFACERQEYLNENLTKLPLPATMDLTFYDNRPLLELFLNKPVGILALIDEESRFPKATDYTLVDKLNANFSTCPLYVRSKSSFSSSSISSSSSSPSPSIPSFSIIHFAGQVQYDARGFLEKNRDYLAPEIIQILRLSRLQLISSLFNCSLSKTGTLQTHSLSVDSTSQPLNASHNRVQATVSTSFRYSLTDLFSKMTNGSPKFVRCFKPNNERIPNCFDTQTVVEQLKYSGILAAAQIRRFGFSHRIPIGQFIQRYAILVFPLTSHLPLTRETCEMILNKLKMHDWMIGKTKVFLKYFHAEELTRLYAKMLKAIVTIQSAIRMFLVRLQVKRASIDEDESHRIERAIVRIQSAIRGFLQRKRMRRSTKKPTNDEDAALIIQKSFRGFRCRKSFSLYKQRLDVQTLCFLQQIELINQDFYTKIVRTNYCVPMKSIESHPTAKVFLKSVPSLFPPPPPLPLPSPSIPQKSATPLPHPTSATSKFIQVRDVFARHPTLHSIDTTRNPKSTTNSTVLHAVQEYQRQHIKPHQTAIKRLASVTNGHIGTKSRSIVNLKSNSNIITDQQSTASHHPFQVLLRKTGQDLLTGQTLSKRSMISESKQMDFRSVLKSRHTLNGTTDNEMLARTNSLRFHDI